MKLNCALTAEGITQDSRGAITAVGLFQNVLATATLPLTAKRAAVMLITGDSAELVPGKPVKFSICVRTPSGNNIYDNQGVAQIEPTLYPELPFGFNIAADIAFTISEYGKHVIRMTAKPDDDAEIASEIELYVVLPRNTPSDTLPLYPAYKDCQPLEEDTSRSDRNPGE